MRLGSILRDWRWANHMGIREAAALIGTSPATLSRIENGESVDGKMLIKLFDWLFHDGDMDLPRRQRPTQPESGEG